jgi:hypothetical protein
VHNLDIADIVRRLNTKPVVRVVAGMFVGYLEDREYVLGSADMGVEPAVRKMVRMCREDRMDLGRTA